MKLEEKYLPTFTPNLHSKSVISIYMYVVHIELTSILESKLEESTECIFQ